MPDHDYGAPTAAEKLRHLESIGVVFGNIPYTTKLRAAEYVLGDVSVRGMLTFAVRSSAYDLQSKINIFLRLARK